MSCYTILNSDEMPPPPMHAVPPRVVIRRSRDRRGRPPQNGRIRLSYSIRNSQSQDRLFKWLKDSGDQSGDGASQTSKNSINRKARNGWRSKSHEGIYFLSHDHNLTGSCDDIGKGYKLDERRSHDRQLIGSCDNVHQLNNGSQSHQRSHDKRRSKSHDPREARLYGAESEKSLEQKGQYMGGFTLKGKQVLLNDSLNRSIRYSHFISLRLKYFEAI